MPYSSLLDLTKAPLLVHREQPKTVPLCVTSLSVSISAAGHATDCANIYPFAGRSMAIELPTSLFTKVVEVTLSSEERTEIR